MACDLCNSTAQNARTKHVHERLLQIGITERLTRSPRTKAIWVTRFRCQICGTQWRHEHNMHTGQAGWTLDHQAATAE